MQILKAVQEVSDKLHQAGFEAYLVGGCVRDYLRDVLPKDWDITTNATPEKIEKIFPRHFTNNPFGTVVVQHGGLDIEVTPYRTEHGYSDARHPDTVTFGASLEEDLARRDLTINAMALSLKDHQVIDLYGGQKDLQKKLIRAVGDPNQRFQEDALRLLRALRFSAELGFRIEPQTWQALCANVNQIQKISHERVRDELIKMLKSDEPVRGFWLMLESGMMQILFPELLEGQGVMQNKHHVYTVLFHNLLSLQHCTSDDYLVRLATLLHDVGKPRTKQGEGLNCTFHAHAVVGARMARNILQRLRFSNAEIQKVVHLVRHHMFYYSIGEVTDAGVRRMLKRLGPENVDDFIALRVGDRMGSGTQEEIPWKLQLLLKHLVDVQRDPITVQSLAIRGEDLIKELQLQPGPIVGALQEALLEEVLDDPKRNTREYLLERARAMNHEEVLQQYRDRRKRNQEESKKLFRSGVDESNFIHLGT